MDWCSPYCRFQYKGNFLIVEFGRALARPIQSSSTRLKSAKDDEFEYAKTFILFAATAFDNVKRAVNTPKNLIWLL